MELTYRKARFSDLATIVGLLSEDELGHTREESSANAVGQSYIDAFRSIDADPNQYLMLVEESGEVVATCHLTLMPSLTFKGALRMQMEAVRVAKKRRGQKIGEWMIQAAIAHAQALGVKILQLSTNKKRVGAKKFYGQLGFEATHEGMKLFLK